jgi:hypothetical protein
MNIYMLISVKRRKSTFLKQETIVLRYENENLTFKRIFFILIFVSNSITEIETVLFK